MSDTSGDGRQGSLVAVNPPGLGAPRGFAHGLLAPAGGRILYVAGQTAEREDGRIATEGFTGQFEIALERVVAVVRAAGGHPHHVTRMTMYVTSMDEYRDSRPQLRGAWRRHMGDHYPAMAVVQVTSLVDEAARVEIEADAVLP
jgi:enamine deaminase RidA (YjgF/YER057c/UK114 family)